LRLYPADLTFHVYDLESVLKQ